MMIFPTSYWDELLAEDIPWGDETAELLGLEDQAGFVSAQARAAGIVSGVMPAAELARYVGLVATPLVRDGARVEAGTPVLTLEGSAGRLHAVYKTVQRLMETCSGIANRTRAMVDAAQSANPLCQVALTRKHFPGAKRLSLYAVTTGGGILHRSGLSESILVFDAHRVFLTDPIEAVAQMVKRSPERRVAVEVDSPEDGLRYLDAGADIIQCEKFEVARLAAFVARVRATYPERKVIAAGGINATNAASFAATGVDALVTSWPYWAQPWDVKMRFSTKPSATPSP